MAREHLTAATIGELHDGRLGVAIDKQLRAIARDCYERPGVADARTLTIKLQVKPMLGDDGLCEHVAFRGEVKTSTPPYGGKAMLGNVSQEGIVAYDNLAPDNPDQSTLPFDAE